MKIIISSEEIKRILNLIDNGELQFLLCYIKKEDKNYRLISCEEKQEGIIKIYEKDLMSYSVLNEGSITLNIKKKENIFIIVK